MLDDHDYDEVTLHLTNYQRWRENSGEGSFSLLDYVGCVGTPDLFWGFLSVLYPRLLLHDGRYFLKDRFSLDVYHQWREKLSDLSEIQKLMNHVHISVLFQNQGIPDHVAEATAKAIAECWNTAFASLDITAVAWGQDLWTAQVTLFQV